MNEYRTTLTCVFVHSSVWSLWVDEGCSLPPSQPCPQQNLCNVISELLLTALPLFATVFQSIRICLYGGTSQQETVVDLLMGAPVFQLCNISGVAQLEAGSTLNLREGFSVFAVYYGL